MAFLLRRLIDSQLIIACLRMLKEVLPQSNEGSGGRGIPWCVGVIVKRPVGGESLPRCKIESKCLR